MISSDFHCKENDGCRLVPVHPGLPGHAGLHSDSEFMNTIITGDESLVYEYDMRMKVQGRLLQARFIDTHQVFAKNKVGYFSNSILH